MAAQIRPSPGNASRPPSGNRRMPGNSSSCRILRSGKFHTRIFGAPSSLFLATLEIVSSLDLLAGWAFICCTAPLENGSKRRFAFLSTLGRSISIGARKFPDCFQGGVEMADISRSATGFLCWWNCLEMSAHLPPFLSVSSLSSSLLPALLL